MFATKAAFFSVFGVLHCFRRTIPDFCDFSEHLHGVLVRKTSENRQSGRPDYSEPEGRLLGCEGVRPTAGSGRRSVAARVAGEIGCKVGHDVRP